MINGQLYFDWPFHWPLNDPMIGVLHDFEWPDQLNSVSNGGEGEILIVSDSEDNEDETSADNESIGSNTPSTEIESV